MRTLKRSLAIVLAIAMVLTTFGMTVVSAASYADTTGHWAESYINSWSDRGVIQGDGGYFRPDDTITRAEVAQVTQNVIGYVDKAANNFSDVDSSAWYADAVLKLVAAGTLNGNGDGTMAPQSFMTREEAMTMLARAYGLTVENSQAAITQYSDYQSVSDYATGYVGAMTAAGYVGGYEDGTIRPGAYISRAEFVKILDNMIKLYITAPGTYGPEYAGGIVMIKSGEVVLNGIVANGMVISPQVGGNVDITNCQVSGNVVNLSKVANVNSNVNVTAPNSTTAPNNVVVSGINGGNSYGGPGGPGTTSVKVTFYWGDDYKGTETVNVTKNTKMSARRVPDPSAKGDDNWNGLWYTSKSSAQSGKGTSFDPTARNISSAMTLYAGRISAVPTDAPATATPAPGQPTATVAPGQPTATVQPGQPTATVQPGQPTATVTPVQPTPGVNSYKATLNVTGGTGSLKAAAATVNAAADTTWTFGEDTSSAIAAGTVDLGNGMSFISDGKAGYAVGAEVDGITFSNRIKFGGKSTFTAGKESRVFVFTPAEAGTLTVYFIHGSSDNSVRNCVVMQDGAKLFEKAAPSKPREAEEGKYDGVPTSVTGTVAAGKPVYVGCDNNIAIYGITLTTAGDAPADPTATPADAPATATAAPADPTATTAPAAPTDAPNVYTFVEGTTVNYVGEAATAGEVPTVVVTAKDGSNVAVNGTSFVMPSQDVTVTVTYAAPVVVPTSTVAPAPEETATAAPNPAELNYYYANGIYNASSLFNAPTAAEWSAADFNAENYEAFGSPFGDTADFNTKYGATSDATFAIDSFIVDTDGLYNINILAREYKNRGYKVVITKEGETTPAYSTDLVQPESKAPVIGKIGNANMTILQDKDINLTAGTYKIELVAPETGDGKTPGKLAAISVVKQGETPVYPGKVEPKPVPTPEPTSTPGVTDPTGTPGATDPTSTPNATEYVASVGTVTGGTIVLSKTPEAAVVAAGDNDKTWNFAYAEGSEWWTDATTAKAFELSTADASTFTNDGLTFGTVAKVGANSDGSAKTIKADKTFLNLGASSSCYVEYKAPVNGTLKVTICTTKDIDGTTNTPRTVLVSKNGGEAETVTYAPTGYVANTPVEYEYTLAANDTLRVKGGTNGYNLLGLQFTEGAAVADPTDAPATDAPTATPTLAPTEAPTEAPTAEPTLAPGAVKAAAGTTIYVIGTPAEAEQVITAVTGTDVTASKVSDNVWSFVMPAHDVAVDATFGEKPAEPTATPTIEPSATPSTEPTATVTPSAGPTTPRTSFTNNYLVKDGHNDGFWIGAQAGAAASEADGVLTLENRYMAFYLPKDVDLSTDTFTLSYDYNKVAYDASGRSFRIYFAGEELAKDPETGFETEEVNTTTNNIKALWHLTDIGKKVYNGTDVTKLGSSNASENTEVSATELADNTWYKVTFTADNTGVEVSFVPYTDYANKTLGDTGIVSGKTAYISDSQKTLKAIRFVATRVTKEKYANFNYTITGAEPTVTPTLEPTATPTLEPTATPKTDVTVSGSITLDGVYQATNKKDNYKMLGSDLQLSFSDGTDSVTATLTGTQDTDLAYTADLKKNTAYTATIGDKNGNTYIISAGGSLTTTEADNNAANITATKTYTVSVPITISANALAKYASNDKLYINFGTYQFNGAGESIQPESIEFDKSELKAGEKVVITAHNYLAHSTDATKDPWNNSYFSATKGNTTNPEGIKADGAGQNAFTITDANAVIPYKDITVTFPVTKIEIAGEDTITPGTTDQQYTATVTPADAVQEVEWSIQTTTESATGVSISTDGKVTATAGATEGSDWTIKATATDGSGVFATKNISVPSSTPEVIALSGNIKLTNVYNNKDNKKDTYAMSSKDLTLTLKPQGGGSPVEATIKGATGAPAVENSITNLTGLSYTVSELAEGTYDLELKDTLGNVYEISSGGSFTRSGTEAQTNDVTAKKLYAIKVNLTVSQAIYDTIPETAYIYISRGLENKKSFSFKKSELVQDGTNYKATIISTNHSANDTDGAGNNYGRVILASDSTGTQIGSANANEQALGVSELPFILYNLTVNN